MELLSYRKEELKEHIESLSDRAKEELYRKILKKAKEAIKEGREIEEIKQLSRAAVMIEEKIEGKFFNDSNPFKEVNMVVYAGEGNVNYLFSIGNSSELYDVKEDREKALYQGVKSNDVEIIKHLLMILVPEEICLNKPTELEISTYFGNRTEIYKLRDRGNDEIKEINLKYVKELEKLLKEFYEELKPNLTKEMKSYLEEKLRFYKFLCDAKVKEKGQSELVKLFEERKEIDYQVDLLLLSLIAEYVKEEEVVEKIKEIVNLLEKYKECEELKYKVRRLKSELSSGKSKYSKEMMRTSIERRENEMKEIEVKYMKKVNLEEEREKLVKKLQQIS